MQSVHTQVIDVAERAVPRPKPASASYSRRERAKARERFTAGRKAGTFYARQLRAVARQVGELIEGFNVALPSLELAASLRDTLSRYADTLIPWARSVAQKMWEQVSLRDTAAWEAQSRMMGRSLSREIRRAPTGELMRQLMDEQVSLITSLPREAAQRVHKLTIEGISNGVRADEIRDEILRTGQVTRSRAMLIARTEVARTSGALTQARAQHIGSEQYVWRTAEDSDVRPLHKRLNGRVFYWDKPPVAGENGERANPGMIYNCRCYPEPIIPDLA